MDNESRIDLGEDCYIDLNGGILMKDGEVRYLTPIALRLLIYLALHMGETLTADELIRRAWGTQGMVQRDELYVYARKIRVALEDHPSDPTCLITVRHEGYVLHPRKKNKNDVQDEGVSSGSGESVTVGVES